MKKETQKNLILSLIYLSTFTVWTILVKYIDVKPIGPKGSSIGFATINELVHNLTDVNMLLYNITDWLGLVPIAFAFGFAVLGLIQWIKRKNLLKVDYDILILGLYYTLVIAVYLLFETVVINYRPVLICGYLEVSYPSSTTMLVLTVMPTAIIQLNDRIKNSAIKISLSSVITLFMIFMVLGRLISGVHWFSDIVGGLLLSLGLINLYIFALKLKL